MKLFVISLPQAAQRRRSVQTQLDGAGQAFSFFDELQGAEAWRQFAGYDSRDYIIHTGRRPLAGEAGRYASHLALWRHCIEIDESIIVMEDNIELQSSFAAACLEVKALIDRFGFIRMEETRPSHTVPVMKAGHFRLSYCHKYPHGAACYAISPDVAKSFVAHSSVLRAPVDKFIKKFWEHEQPLYALEPSPAKQCKPALTLQISERVAKRTSFAVRLRRMVRKAGWYAKRARFNARILKAPKQGKRQFRAGAAPPRRQVT